MFADSVIHGFLRSPLRYYLGRSARSPALLRARSAPGLTRPLGLHLATLKSYYVAADLLVSRSFAVMLRDRKANLPVRAATALPSGNEWD